MVTKKGKISLEDIDEMINDLKFIKEYRDYIISENILLTVSNKILFLKEEIEYELETEHNLSEAIGDATASAIDNGEIEF